jgi:hypothetical protein
MPARSARPSPSCSSLTNRAVAPLSLPKPRSSAVAEWEVGKATARERIAGSFLWALNRDLHFTPYCLVGGAALPRSASPRADSPWDRPRGLVERRAAAGTAPRPPRATRPAAPRWPCRGKERMVAAQRLKGDVRGHDQLVVTLVVGKGGRVEAPRGQQLGVGLSDAPRRLA